MFTLRTKILSGHAVWLCAKYRRRFHTDDVLFYAALVGLGSFGIIHGIMIETRELFLLNAIRFRHPYNAALKAAITACDPTQLPLPADAGTVPRDSPIISKFLSIPTRVHLLTRQSYT